MCHSLTGLPDGRVLLLGGRNKEGICHDQWWLEQVQTTPALKERVDNESGCALKTVLQHNF
jgi:hypothetical protein